LERLIGGVYLCIVCFFLSGRLILVVIFEQGKESFGGSWTLPNWTLLAILPKNWLPAQYMELKQVEVAHLV
jgi:hypothetical protein